MYQWKYHPDFQDADADGFIAADAGGMDRAREAQVAIGRASIEMGGCPLAEQMKGSPVRSRATG